jgi:hypothetical protein
MLAVHEARPLLRMCFIDITPSRIQLHCYAACWQTQTRSPGATPDSAESQRSGVHVSH